jgi:hypothetical protein
VKDRWASESKRSRDAGIGVKRIPGLERDLAGFSFRPVSCGVDGSALGRRC